ncbi:V-set and immunoglobulin domain-containing protein 10-like isoform 3-T3 [Fundulus diaphanus]
MKGQEGFQKLSAVVLSVLFISSFQGAHGQVELIPVGPTLVNALGGSNVTLAVSFSGARDPVVTWFKGNQPVVTWIINSNSPADIANDSSNVLRIENNGSLTFKDVPKRFTGIYTVEFTKSGLGMVSATFTLNIFERIQNVTLSTQPAFAQEGAERFTLQYSMLQGVVEQQTWRFNGKELQNGTRYMIKGSSLVIFGPKRTDKGSYSVLLENPFSSVTTLINVTVLYGPDEPIVEPLSVQPFYEAGDSLLFLCRAEGFPQPTIEWVFGGRTVSDFHQGVLNLTNVQTNQGGVYTCSVFNELTEKKLEKNITLNIYERPLGNPLCSVTSVNNTDLQYQCRWAGGTPQARLSFPALSNTSSGAGTFSLTVTASNNFEKTLICLASHPLEQNTCNVTASGPIHFLPIVKTTIDADGKIVVTIHCVSEASPQAVVSWSRGDEALLDGLAYQISSDTTQLKIRSYNISIFLLTPNFTCTCRNPLGSQRKQVQLLGPSISDSSLFPNQDGTIITLTWEVPPTSIVTGYQTRYPVSRAVEKVKNIQHNAAPHNNGVLRSPPDYNRLNQTPSERSVTLPTFVPPPPVRVATTV